MMVSMSSNKVVIYNAYKERLQQVVNLTMKVSQLDVLLEAADSNIEAKDLSIALLTRQIEAGYGKQPKRVKLRRRA